MSKISLIIVAYDDRGWLDDAILSAKNQTFRDYEIILCSDGNPKLEAYAHKHNIDFILSPKKNWSTCFNKAVRGCNSEFVKWLDDDDLLTPNCLKDLYYGIRDNDVVYANAINFNLSGEYLFKSPPDIKYEDFFINGELGANQLHGGTVLIRRSSFLDVGGADESLYKAEEYELWLNLMSSGYKFRYINSTVVRYRRHGNQNSTRIDPAERARILYYLKTVKGYAM